MRLVASDNLNENYTTVVIHVNDVNDNPPVFDRPTYETQITEEDDRNLPKRVLKVTDCSLFSLIMSFVLHPPSLCFVHIISLCNIVYRARSRVYIEVPSFEF